MKSFVNRKPVFQLKELNAGILEEMLSIFPATNHYDARKHKLLFLDITTYYVGHRIINKHEEGATS